MNTNALSAMNTKCCVPRSCTFPSFCLAFNVLWLLLYLGYGLFPFAGTGPVKHWDQEDRSEKVCVVLKLRDITVLNTCFIRLSIGPLVNWRPVYMKIYKHRILRWITMHDMKMTWLGTYGIFIEIIDFIATAMHAYWFWSWFCHFHTDIHQLTNWQRNYRISCLY